MFCHCLLMFSDFAVVGAARGAGTDTRMVSPDRTRFTDITLSCQRGTRHFRDAETNGASIQERGEAPCMTCSRAEETGVST